VVEFLDQQSSRRRTKGIPGNIALPFPFSSQRTGEVQRAGPYAAFLGSAWNPVWTAFDGKATVRTTKTLGEQKLDVGEPYMGISPESRFTIHTGGDAAPAGLTLDRLDTRRSLLEQLPFVEGYGVDIALLIDVASRFGLDAIAQVDLGTRVHRNRPIDELSPQALDVMQAVLSRAGHPVAPSTTLYRPGLQPVDVEIAERPPLASLGDRSRVRRGA
jgi:hypothetical protein